MKTFNNLFKTLCIALVISFYFPSNASGQEWIQLNDTPFYRHHSNGFGIGDKAYIFEGGISGIISDTVWEYIPATDTWNEIAQFPGGKRGFAIGDDWNGKYYYGFGRNEEERLVDVWVFDPSDTSFVELPSCPCEGRTHPAFIAHNDKIFMGAGSGADGNLGDWWVLDLITLEWSQKDDIPGEKRHHPFQFTIGDKIYVGGGHRENWEVYDPELESWSPIDNLPKGRVAGSQFSYKNYGFLLGGDDASHNHVPDNESFMYYDASEDVWTKLPELPIGSKWANSSFVIEDNVYFFGGVKYGTDNETSMWKFDLSEIDCLPATNLSASNITEESAELFWNSNRSKLVDTLFYRVKGNSNWEIVAEASPIEVLDGLLSCTTYEYQIASSCLDLTSYSKIDTFTTNGCCYNPPVSFEGVTTNSILVNWDSVQMGTEYIIRWRLQGTTTWETATTDQLNYLIDNLLLCEVYDFQISTTCDGSALSFSESIPIRTLGCGACLDESYCAVKGTLNGGNEGYIQRVQIGSFENLSGNDNGYGEFIIPESELFTIGETYSISLDLTPNALDLKVWIDFNANGEFDNSELVFIEANTGGFLQFDINIPDETLEGLTRMRVLYAKSENQLIACPDPLDTLRGEAEDYCLNFSLPSNTNDDLNLKTFTVYPLPASSAVRLKGNIKTNKTYKLSIIDLLGAQVYHNPLYNFGDHIDLTTMPSGSYIIQLRDGMASITSKLIVE